MPTPLWNEERVEGLLAEQIAFYRADASAYEAWQAEVFGRGGGGDFGEACRLDRQRALTQLKSFGPRGQVLELAAGTGAYTPALLESADHVTAVDASPESLELARAKLARCSDRVTWVEADIFDWIPPRRYDTVFFAFWLSHVPMNRFEAFWSLVSGALVPGGLVFLVDSAETHANPGGPAPRAGSYREQDDLDRQVSIRELEGRRFSVVKVAWQPRELERRLATLGWTASLQRGELSIWGSAQLLGDGLRPT